MAPRDPTRQEIIDLLGRATVQAQRAEDYHEAAADPAALKGQAPIRRHATPLRCN
jgi:hypothetical protein